MGGEAKKGGDESLMKLLRVPKYQEREEDCEKGIRRKGENRRAMASPSCGRA